MPTETVGMSTVFRDGRAVERERQCARLRVTDGPAAGSVAEVDSPPVYVGRAEVNDLVVDDEAISGSHLAVEVREGGFLLRDLDSRNGTHLNGCRVREIFLEPDVPVRIGRSTLVLEVDDDSETVPLADREEFHGMVGRSPVMRELYRTLDQIATSGLSCLITGETGTGKERVAHALHAASDRSDGPFEVLDCSAVPSDLIESRIFGHERGAFTGAVESREGVFERADGGTVFLDEIGELDLALQPKLLRVLEERQFQRVGGDETVEVDVRVVAATNRDVRRAVGEGEFREDLFFRLAVAEIELPPLERRRTDIPLLAEHFVERWNDEHPDVSTRRLSPEALSALRERDWPGNVRQLRNAVRRAAGLSRESLIRPEDLAGPPAIEPTVEPPGHTEQGSGELSVDHDRDFKDAKEAVVEAFEAQYLARLFEICDENVTRTAERAGLSRYHTRQLLEKHGLRE